MKRIFIFSVLMIAFVMNAVAWEPVIKETHWFGMREYYESPVVGVNQSLTDTYLGHADFHNYSWSQFGSWAEEKNTTTCSLGHGNIGSYTVNTNQEAGLSPVPTDGTHTSSEFCIGIQVRWTDNSNPSYAAYTQTTGKKLPAGRYRLSYDVLNNNDHTWSTDNPYFSKFYVQFGETTVTDKNTDWVTTRNVWLNHTIEFELTTNSRIKVSLGYGNNQNLPQTNTPAVYVSHLKLEPIGNDNESVSHIEWLNQNSKDYIKSITVVKDWCFDDHNPLPKTSYYSWLDHELRFSVDNKSAWGLSKDNNDNHYTYDGLGLCNTSDGYQTFYIHNLKAGDKFNLEYYRYDSQINQGVPSPQLVSGSVDELNTGENIYGTAYYTVNSDGNICINIPSKTIIRAVRIEHKNYQKATTRIDELTEQELQDLAGHTETKGYRCTMTGAGVLEDKRGAVPYITMRFGAENDMTFVRKLENGEYGAACIVDGSNDFDPNKLQAYYKNMGIDADEAKNRHEGKEWTVFTSKKDNNGGDDFPTIFPMYGSYYYFFPEVNGILKVRFYCEGNEESPAFWYKQQETVSGEIERRDVFPDCTITGMNGDGRTSGGNFYELTVNVQRGGTYYLCSNPTIVQHELPIIRVVSYEFVPTFYVKPLWKAVPNGTTTVGDGSNGNTYAAEIGYGVFNDLEGTVTGQMKINGVNRDKVQCWGNVSSAEAYVQTVQGKQYLGFRNITFKTTKGKEDNQGGAIVAHLNGAAGHATFVLTIAYDAKNKNNDGTPEEVQVKKWDFYTDGLSIGQYKDEGSILYSEVHKADGLTADWVNTYLDLLGESGDGTSPREPIFKSVYDMEGDNADMLHETAGLLFFSDANKLAIYNEDFTSSTKTKFEDSYIGMMPGSEICIPYLKDGDRIVVKMGHSVLDNDITLEVKGAKDAVGKQITSDYKISGSYANDEKWEEKNFPHVEYHFIKDGDGGDGTENANDFRLIVKDAEMGKNTEMVKFYTIEIYRSAKNDNADIITENKLISQNNRRQILNTSEYEHADNIKLHPYYYGLSESANYVPPIEVKTGNLQVSDIEPTGEPETLWYTFAVTPLPTAANPKFGIFKARHGVKTTDEKYVTDYADCLIPVGFRETKTYPYTWDFTDLKKYVSAGIDENGTEKEVADADADLRIWDEWNLRVKAEEWDGNVFVSGGQLYGGKTMFEETRGIGITHNSNNNIATMTSEVEDEVDTKENGGLSISDASSYGFIIPQLAKDQAIYVRATKVGTTQNVTYHVSDGKTTYSYDAHPENEKAFTDTDDTYSTYTATDNGDDIFAMAMPSTLADDDRFDVRLSFKGYEVKKIAVSTAPKTLSAKGWTSESRDYVTDPSLTSYMTGKKFRTYIVSDVDYSTKTVTLTRIDNVGEACLMPAAEADGDKNACVILNGTADSGIEGNSAGVFGTQFHLFVPDMHDYGTEDDEEEDDEEDDDEEVTYLKSLYNTSGSMLKAKLNPGDVSAVDGEYTNFAFTCMYYDLDPETGAIKPGQTEKKVGPQAFYRIAGGKTGTASSKGNQGYLPILTSKVGYPKEQGATGAAGARFTLVIIDDNEATGIATVERIVQDGRFYNLNGQQLDGTPNRSGLYIVNGKKVYIKNK